VVPAHFKVFPRIEGLRVMAISKSMIQYMRLVDGDALPEISRPRLFKMVVIADDAVSPAWREEVCQWAKDAGCMFSLAWGPKRSEWNDLVQGSVFLSIWNCEASAEDPFKDLDEVFWYTKFGAYHPTVTLNDTLLFHIGHTSREDELISAYERAAPGDEE
jgi:hypothetical protein